MSLMKDEEPDVFIEGGEGKLHGGLSLTSIVVDLRTLLQKQSSRTCISFFTMFVLLFISVAHFIIATSVPKTTTIENAQVAMLDLGDGIEMWYRTWGNRQSGVPVLFVHGGPGNSVADVCTSKHCSNLF